MFASSPFRGSFLRGVLALSVKPCRACQLSQRESPWQCGKVSGSSAKFAGVSAPPGGAVAQRLRGFKSAEPEKTVKRSSRRTGVNLQFFSGGAHFFGVKRGEQPLFRGSSASKSLALFWFSFGVKREQSSANRNFPRGDHFKSSHAKSSRCTFSCGGCFVYLC